MPPQYETAEGAERPKTLAALLRTAWRESREEVREHLKGAALTLAGTLALGSGAGGIGAGLGGALIGAIGVPFLVAVGLYLWKLWWAAASMLRPQKILVRGAIILLVPLLFVVIRLAGAALSSEPSATDASKIAEAAADAALRKHAVKQPRFALVYKNCASKIGPIECLEVWNRGGNIKSFEVYHYATVDFYAPKQMAYVAAPTYYFYDRRTTGRKSGKLVTLLAMFRDKNCRSEFDRLDRETDKEWGEWQGASLRLFVEIDYADSTGSSQQISYELQPHQRFTPPAILEYKASSVFGPLIGYAQAPWELTASKLRANAEHYPTTREVYPREFRGDE